VKRCIASLAGLFNFFIRIQALILLALMFSAAEEGGDVRDYRYNPSEAIGK